MERKQATEAKVVEGSGGIKATVDLPDDQTLEAGRLFVRLSTIELSLEGLIWTLAGLDGPTGSLLTRMLDISKKQRRLDELLELKNAPAEALDAWVKAKKAISCAVERRNWLAHAVPISVGGTVLLMRTRNAAIGSALATKPVTLADLKTANEKASEALGHLERLLPWVEPSTSAGTP